MQSLSTKDVEIIVVGAGHAGCEAALAAARSGVNTLLITNTIKSAAQMPCNPSIGGIAKSHLVSEIDALGGEIARNTDYTGIQFRILNTSKGPAVRSIRAQCDKECYSKRMQSILNSTKNLLILNSMVIGIVVENGKLKGIELDDHSIVKSKAVVITPGTFLNGVIFIGKHSEVGGRRGELATNQMSNSLKSLGFNIFRFKTGTPPRLARNSIDYSKTKIQPGINPAPFFSQVAINDFKTMFHVEQSEGSDYSLKLLKAMFHVEHFSEDMRPWRPGTNQMSCYLTHTTLKTHKIIHDNLDKSALYGGMITGTGVRYCPSIEDKIVKFADKDSHHVFLEPEGRDHPYIYPNGVSNSLPVDVQTDMIHSIPGLEKAVIIKPGYGIEHDVINSLQLNHSLESKNIENLFIAGQINGTTGYEEAAAQGFVAGVNAAKKILGLPPLIVNRFEGYIGVLIDDLVTKGVDEPYRMFTSRAEYRLSLRQDNARYRLLDHSAKIGIVNNETVNQVKKEKEIIENEMIRLQKTFAHGVSQAKILQQPGKSYNDLPNKNNDISAVLVDQVVTNIKYSGYIQREQINIAKSKAQENQGIPAWIDYDQIKSLRYESRRKLKMVRPLNFGQAARISGVNPVDIAILKIYVKSCQSA